MNIRNIKVQSESMKSKRITNSLTKIKHETELPKLNWVFNKITRSFSYINAYYFILQHAE